MQINKAIRANGSEPQYAGGYRVTDDVAMEAAVAAAGSARMEVEARLSKGPAITMVRRHARGSSSSGNGTGGSSSQSAPALTTVSGNYVAAKRKGVVNGVDYKHTGVVRFVQRDAVRYQLDSGNVVLLSNLGYSAAGEVLNCDTYTVAVRAAVDLNADKLILATLPEVQSLELPQWLALKDAEKVLQQMAEALHEERGGGSEQVDFLNATGSATSGGSRKHELQRNHFDSPSTSRPDAELDFDRWYELGLPLPLLAACMVCRSGVKRSHLIDARVDGSLLLELYSRDGVGVMISTDFYEGIRPAGPSDISGIEELMAPLVERGVLVQRTREQMATEIPFFTVIERESKVLACATVKPLGLGNGGEEVAELAAFCVHPDYRGGGKGDSLLEYLETNARSKGIQRLVLLTTRTADWFEQRGFRSAGPAHLSDLLPETRRSKVVASRNSLLYSKDLNA